MLNTLNVRNMSKQTKTHKLTFLIGFFLGFLIFAAFPISSCIFWVYVVSFNCFGFLCFVFWFYLFLSNNRLCLWLFPG